MTYLSAKFRLMVLPVIAFAVANFVTIVSAQARKTEPPREFQIKTLSTRPDTISGGDVLVRIDVPRPLPLDQVRVSVDGRDVTRAFAPDPVRSGALLGLIDGLKLGANTIEVRARRGHDRPSAELTLTNHPITGPVFSGPHQKPFFCETEVFGLGPALDEHCSVHTQVRYLYFSTKTDTFEPFNPDAPRPGDLAQTTTTEGNTVDFIVRLETGTINRAVYQIAFLHRPGTPLPSPRTRTPGWNGRLVYTFGGGARASYHQGRWITGGSTGQPGAGILAESTIGGVGRPVADGFAMASSTFNVNNIAGNDVISAETAMMVKERFVEQYGEPRYTIGFGASGGSMQQHLLAHNYPGILDGLLPGSSFPDTWTFLLPYLDCALVDRAFNTSRPSGEAWTTEQKAAAIGHRTYQYCSGSFPNWRTRIHATDGCDPSIPKDLIFDPEGNPHGTRCTLQDNLVNIFGTDRATGYARRALDNVGVQYGLNAFNSWTITFEQFAGLNEGVGGFDIDGNVVPNRMAGDPLALATAYRTGRINSGAGLDAVPIIDLHTYRDHLGDLHDSRRRFIMRARLIAANGHADNQVKWTDASGSPELRHMALRVMDKWLANIVSDEAAGSAAEKVVRNKPADLVDTCFTESEEKVTDPATCARLYPPQGNPRIAAGGPLTDDVLKCGLKPARRSDYAQPLADAQFGRLQAIFPDGVCDYSVPGVGQQPVMGTWLRF